MRWNPFALLFSIETRITLIMAALDEIKALIAKNEADLAGLVATFNTATAAQQATITLLQAQIAAGTPVTVADLQVIKDGLTAIDTTILAAVPVPVTPPAPVPAPVPAPAPVKPAV